MELLSYHRIVALGDQEAGPVGAFQFKRADIDSPATIAEWPEEIRLLFEADPKESHAIQRIGRQLFLTGPNEFQQVVENDFWIVFNEDLSIIVVQPLPFSEFYADDESVEKAKADLEQKRAGDEVNRDATEPFEAKPTDDIETIP